MANEVSSGSEIHCEHRNNSNKSTSTNRQDRWTRFLHFSHAMNASSKCHVDIEVDAGAIVQKLATVQVGMLLEEDEVEEKERYEEWLVEEEARAISQTV